MATPPAQRLRLALVGTYPPRQCGIATFGRDLAGAMDDGTGGRDLAQPASWLDRPLATVGVVAADDEERDFPDEVLWRLDTSRPADYVAVADRLNRSQVDAVLLQHEFGIYGGPDGERVLDLVGELDVPLVTTLHTVLPQPSANQRRILIELAERSERLVVLSGLAAITLAESYGLDPRLIQVIPHGVPDLALVDPETVKPLVGLAGRPTVLSFGLLGPGKGYELAIRAMADVIRLVPDACYVILGTTHPELRRREGEAYRDSLKALVRELGLGASVRFVDEFVDPATLGRWLQAADVFVTPYPGADQAVSGTLAYALGTGKALVSTPYPYARELLAEGRGRLVPFGDSAALGREIGGFLTDRAARDEARRRAYAYGRAMTWPNVGAAYRDLLAEVAATARMSRLSSAGRRPAAASSGRTGTLQREDGVAPLG